MENKLYRTGKECLGKDMSKTQNELGCVEALSAVFYKAIGQELGENLSTIKLYNRLLLDRRFYRVIEPQPGTIIISPTIGQTIGHCGIISDEISDKNFLIMSNRSSDSLWSEHLTLADWWYKYKNLPTAFFRFQFPAEPAIIIQDIERQKISILQKIVAIYQQIISQLSIKKLGSKNMFQNYSLTYTGVIVFIVGFVFKSAGVPFIEGDLQTTISFITTGVGVVATLIGRYRAGGVSVFGSKRSLSLAEE